MPEYKIELSFTVFHDYYIHANSEEEALDLLEDIDKGKG